jgi:glycosyltransferase involved in cell wall biosynthesis
MIFVNIASYRDPEIGPTIVDLFQKAWYPNEINVGLVLQTLSGDDCTIRHDRVGIVHINAEVARGPCWARHMGYKLWAGEDYVLQIDSHMRFAEGWDRLLLDELALCPSGKPLLTTYPCGYEPPNRIMSTASVFLAAKAFSASGVLSQQGIVRPPPAVPLKTAFLGAGFLFGPAAWIHQVPYDPLLYFLGEETTLAARLWTSGWDLFGPTRCIVWHNYVPKSRPLHWDDHTNWGAADIRSMARVRRILRMDDAPLDVSGFDLGSVRSFDSYVRFSGVNFRTRTIAPYALDGDFT